MTRSIANDTRNYGIFERSFYHLLSRWRDLTPKHRFLFKNPLYSIDATTIDLCQSVFPCAKLRKTKGAITIHCLYDHSGARTSILVVTDGQKQDFRVVKEYAYPLLPGSIVSTDKACIDYT